MKILPTARPLAFALIACLSVAAAARAEQETLTRAKDYYAAAAYEEALDVLNKLRASAPSSEATEVAVYQMFCLLALGRSDEAKQSIEAIVRVDPLYHLPEGHASPRVRALFEGVRRPLLPEIVKRMYAHAKGLFDRKEMAAAAAEFDRVIALLDDAELSEMQGVADLRTLAGGFRDLSRIAATPALPPVPVPAPAPASDPPPTVPERVVPRIYGANDVSVSRPIAISQALPLWRPATPIEARQDFRGALEVVIDETGAVTSAVMRQNVHRLYDPVLVEAARRWKFQPATLNRSPVPYRLMVEIHLRPGGVER